MKKYFLVALIILGLGVLSWAQGSKDLFDVKKSEAEMEIMKGILSTTISYIAQNYQKAALRFNASSMGAYYLYGQGATFVISTSGLRPLDMSPFGENIKLALELSKVKDESQTLALYAQNRAAEIEKATQILNNISGSGTGSGKETGVGPGSGPGVGPGSGGGMGGGSGSGKGSGLAAPPVPPKPPVPPAPPAPPQVDREALRNKVEEYQMAMKKSREEEAATHEKFLESLKEIRVYLIEALANYGDSLTQVKPGEYVNLILYTDAFDSDTSRMKTRHDIISAQKSWITDYKAGRISLDTFKQKVLQYTE